MVKRTKQEKTRLRVRGGQTAKMAASNGVGMEVDATVKQVFKDMEFLGWYTTGGAPDQSDIHIHKQVCEIIESPLFLKLNPMTKHTDLPVSVFESVIDIISGEQCNDVGLMAYLGSITKTCNSMNQFINKFNVLYDRQGIGRRMRGLFF
ncbi:COP9 signalosome complex subunit 6 [Anabarilius grahami]|uniref:COP9 signalosome complex subunit 6 n=1 Tax=Anabarilius grahami TaxID=495550 RepID=A0A3N0Z523_ANAGA|nr:COP9 signalosome complex subunit 6 [Anabarilius grahami]